MKKSFDFGQKDEFWQEMDEIMIRVRGIEDIVKSSTISV